MIIKLKSNVKVLTLSKLLDKYNIKDRTNNLSVCIDSENIDHPESIIATEDEIVSLGIEKNSFDIRRINIITLYHISSKTVYHSEYNFYLGKYETNGY